eukprot:5848480-Amphidinium_carterae.1
MKRKALSCCSATNIDHCPPGSADFVRTTADIASSNKAKSMHKHQKSLARLTIQFSNSAVLEHASRGYHPHKRFHR